ncbi:astacin, partial [Teladorsagia circumcincta]
MEQKKDGSRRKRQVDRGARRWTNNRLFYYFDNSVGARMKGIVKDALTFVRDRTCLDFTESFTAANRVRVFSGAGCFATIGMAGGEQSLSLGSGCEAVGIAAHEFAHALGVWHTQMRDDRDSFLRVDLSSVPPPGCGEMLMATDRWQVKRFTFGSSSGGVRDTFIECNHWIT